jgi:hypothetical protein
MLVLKMAKDHPRLGPRRVYSNIRLSRNISVETVETVMAIVEVVREHPNLDPTQIYAALHSRVLLEVIQEVTSAMMSMIL